MVTANGTVELPPCQVGQFNVSELYPPSGIVARDSLALRGTWSRIPPAGIFPNLVRCDSLRTTAAAAGAHPLQDRTLPICRQLRCLHMGSLPTHTCLRMLHMILTRAGYWVPHEFPEARRPAVQALRDLAAAAHVSEGRRAGGVAG